MTKREKPAPKVDAIYFVLWDGAVVGTATSEADAIKAANRLIHLRHVAGAIIVRVAGEVVYESPDEDDES